MTLVWKAAREKARELTEQLDTTDPYTICWALGVEVVETDLPDGISGMIVKRPREDATIFIDASNSKARRRFTCAHELGHFVERTDIANDDDYSFRDVRSSSKYDLHEFFADEFAGALLMPASQLLRDRSSGLGISALAAKYGVSPAAVSKRLERLDADPQ